jgi:hypothetical protein
LASGALLLFALFQVFTQGFIKAGTPLAIAISRPFGCLPIHQVMLQSAYPCKWVVS